MNEDIVEQCKKWVKDYELAFLKNGLLIQSEGYRQLVSSIEFSESKESFEMINHFYKLRNEIQKNHIDKNNFNKRYKTLNEKVVYHLDKMIKKITYIDFQNQRGINRLCVFKSDIPYWKKDLNKRGVL